MLAAEDNGGVLIRSFIIALVVVAPFGLWQWQRRAAQRERDGIRPASGPAGDSTPQPAPDPERATLEEIVARIGATAQPTGVGTFEVPPGITLGGRPCDETVAHSVVTDAILRSGMRVVADDVVDGVRRIDCQVATGPTDPGTMDP